MSVITGQLTSGTVELDKGFEYYTFEVAFSGFEALSKSNDPMQTLVGWYMQNPRPAAKEVVGILDTQLNVAEKRVVITLKIQRGHYMLSNFMFKHVGHKLEDSTLGEADHCIHLRCITCNADEIVYKDSIPHYNDAVLSPDSTDVPATLPSASETPA